ncbi:SDR family oxidoreductase [Salinisphaera sp. Q1T1-3]|uniref:SDR family oxidoreductase n=1 Tax=Salinisphaera sp. Q1T1-3 TaxID=2321229 RepID=UPI000E7344ED|nr:SDR family oxidoreductase [Salinisphaera sp. Q1T1-3]RJS91001.1 SDR family oxidoreductase [Salinisphaera sp. Q1T1-3]
MTRTYLVTGANSGFGRLVTQKLIARGDRIAALARRPEALDDLANSAGDRMIRLHMDLTDKASIDAAIKKAFDRFGRIDVVLSNAGYGTFGAIEELTPDQIRRQIETNLTGTVLFTRSLLPHLRSQRGGRILQVSSEGGRISYPGFSTYHASKWGQEGFVGAVAQEVASFGIDFCLIEPGPTETNFLTGIDMGERIADYDGTPTAQLRDALRSGGFDVPMGDAAKMAAEMLALADAETIPLRVAMGSVAFDNIERELKSRLALIQTQKDLAYRCDQTSNGHRP